MQGILQPQFTPEQAMRLKEMLQDDIGFISTFLKIPNKQKQLVSFIPTPAQTKILQALSGRDIIIKDSQVGCTSILTAKNFKHTITEPNTTSVVVAHEEFLTSRLLERTQVFYDNLPQFLQPKQDRSSSYEKRFPIINSVMYIGTARAQVFGRGEPIHHLHFSECAFYNPGVRERIIIPSINRVPEHGTVELESTPNGEDEFFHPEVLEALEHKSVFKLHILFWWDNIDNQLAPDTVLPIPDSLRGHLDYTAEEQILVKQHQLTENQVRWRRYNIMLAGEMFYQEHVESLDTCFLTIGVPYFDAIVTAAMARLCYPAPGTGPGGAEVWFPPEDGGMYILGLDPGQGKQTESVAHVLRINRVEGSDDVTLRHEATIAGFFDPDSMLTRVLELGKYYHNCMIVIEANSHGLKMASDLMKVYPSLYWRRDIISGTSTMQVGWLTTPRTKPYLLQQLQSALHRLETHDAELVKQFRNMKDVGGGQVITSGLDDRLMAMGISIIGSLGYTFNGSRGYVGSSGWKW